MSNSSNELITSHFSKNRISLISVTWKLLRNQKIGWKLDMKWSFPSLIFHLSESFCTWWKFSLTSGAAMATFRYECVAEYKSEETCIFARILAWSFSNLVHGVFFGSKSKINNTICTQSHFDFKMTLTVKYLHIAFGKCIWHHFLSNIFENLNLASS